MFFHVWAVRQVHSRLVAQFRTPHKPSLCESEESKWFLFAFLPTLILKVPVSAKQKQKGSGKELELRSQTPTKQPWTQISQLYFISFGFYLSSFAFCEATFFHWLLFGNICLNKAQGGCSISVLHDKHNTIWKVLCTVFTHSLFCFRNLTRSLRSLVRFLIISNSCVNNVRAHFPWSILYIQWYPNASLSHWWDL